MTVMDYVSLLVDLDIHILIWQFNGAAPMYRCFDSAGDTKEAFKELQEHLYNNDYSLYQLEKTANRRRVKQLYIQKSEIEL